MKGLNVRVPCSVTRELVYEMAHTNKPYFTDKKGQIDIPKVLHALGFKVDQGGRFRGYYKVEGVYVRDNKRPSIVYKTDVYNGEVRNKIVGRSPRGEVVYGREKHKLYTAYEKVEVLQPTTISKYILEGDFKSIDSIGDIVAYNEGFNALDKPSSQSSRNIVRN